MGGDIRQITVLYLPVFCHGTGGWTVLYVYLSYIYPYSAMEPVAGLCSMFTCLIFTRTLPWNRRLDCALHLPVLYLPVLCHRTGGWTALYIYLSYIYPYSAIEPVAGLCSMFTCFILPVFCHGTGGWTVLYVYLSYIYLHFASRVLITSARAAGSSSSLVCL